MINNYKSLTVWRKGIDLVKEVYFVTKQFPKSEQYGLVSQMRRSAVSIPANIAEGRMRGYEQEFRRFLMNAFASGGELETLIVIAKELPDTMSLDFAKVEVILSEEMRMLNALIHRFDKRSK